MTLNKAQRAQLFAMFGGRCAYCGEALPEKGWHADHIEPVYREWWKKLNPFRYEMVDGKMTKIANDTRLTMMRPENDVIENFFPACAPCNLDKSVYSLDSWRDVLQQKVRVLRDNYSAFRHAERFGLIAVVQSEVTFYFERVAASKLNHNTPTY